MAVQEPSFSLSAGEKEILNIIQEAFPLAKRPFLEVAKRLGRDEKEVIGTVRNLLDRGVIRRIGASFNSELLGLASTLVAMQVPEEKIEEVAGIVGSYPEVTHNYQRDHQYNLWFTIVANDPKRVVDIIGDIKRRTAIQDLYSLPALRRFKVRVKFDL